MNRRIIFEPAWDRTDPDPKKNYGVSCLVLVFQVEGDKGIVEFELLTQWYQEHVMQRRLESLKHDVWKGNKDFLLRAFLDPFPAEVCYSSLTRLSEDDHYFENGFSRVFGGKPFYYQHQYSSETGAEDYKRICYRKLVEEGDESMWKFLEEYYHEVFG